MPTPIRIMNATRTLGAPPGWDEEKNGTCVGLPIRDEDFNGLPAMVSAYEFTPEELVAIQGGAKLELIIVGQAHPPVALAVVQRTDEGLEKRVPEPLSDVERCAVALASALTGSQNVLAACDPYTPQGRRVLNESIAQVAEARRALYQAVEVRVKEIGG